MLVDTHRHARMPQLLLLPLVLVQLGITVRRRRELLRSDRCRGVEKKDLFRGSRKILR